MGIRLLAVTALTLTFGCNGSDASLPSAGGFGGAGASAFGGAASGAGGSVVGAPGGLGGAPAANGGAPVVAGGSSAQGGAPAGAGGSAEGGVPGAGGVPESAGGASAVGGASSGGSGSGGATVGSGGAATCTPNLACTLAPPPSTGDLHQDCVDRINQFRTECACLPALARWTDGEPCADQDSQYDSEQSTAHAGFQAGICPSGSAQDECPGYRSDDQVISSCLQQMWNEGPPPQTPCTGTCFQTYGHFINMTNTRYTKVACGFYTTPAGKVWAAQNFSR